MTTNPDMLDQIIAHKRQELTRLGNVSQADIKPSSRDLCHFIATQKREVAIIAEIKRATPFRGDLTTKPLDAGTLAKIYEDHGAAAISVLTDEKFFKGSLADLEAVSNASALPVIRKDFILDTRQIYQARLYGADAVLLIARILPEPTLRHFLEVCHHIHMRALVEVHDRNELDLALKCGARVIGINNRNLSDGSIDLQVTLDLARHIPKELIVVSESGIESPDDIRKLQGHVDAVLIGTSLITATDPPALLESLVAAGTES